MFTHMTVGVRTNCTYTRSYAGMINMMVGDPLELCVGRSYVGKAPAPARGQHRARTVRG